MDDNAQARTLNRRRYPDLGPKTPVHGAAAGAGAAGAPETEKLAAAPGAASAGAPPGRGREAVWNARSANARSPPSSESSRKRRSSFHAVASSSARWPAVQIGLGWGLYRVTIEPYP